MAYQGMTRGWDYKPTSLVVWKEPGGWWTFGNRCPDQRLGGHTNCALRAVKMAVQYLKFYHPGKKTSVKMARLYPGL